MPNPQTLSMEYFTGRSTPNSLKSQKIRGVQLQLKVAYSVSLRSSSFLVLGNHRIDLPPPTVPPPNMPILRGKGMVISDFVVTRPGAAAKRCRTARILRVCVTKEGPDY